MFRAKEDRSGNRKSQNMLEMEIVSRFQSCSERNREIQDMLNLFETSNSLMHEGKSMYFGKAFLGVKLHVRDGNSFKVPKQF